MSDFDFKENVYVAYKSLFGRKRRSSLSVALNVIIVLFCFLLVVELFFNVFFTGIYIIDRSMRPTLWGADDQTVSGGDFIYIDNYDKPDYGDIVVVYWERTSPEGVNVKGNIIKRVVAFGGDWVELRAGVLYVNDKQVEETYLDADYNSPYASVNTFPPHKVEEGCMFLLGDNRNESNDSRQNGDFPVSSTVGVVPEWSMSLKSITTAVYTFFNFSIFGK